MSQPPIRVLLVEDDEGDFVLTREFLRDVQPGGFELVWHTRLEEACRILDDRVDDKIDAVLLDLSLPDSRGWETFEKMHACAPHTPVILLTGLADEDMGRRAVMSGAQDYLVKGQMDGNTLARAVYYAIERKKTEEQLEQVARELRARDAQLTEDLQMARDVQQAMLPRQYPVFPGGVAQADSALRFTHVYRPSETLGGDFFNVLAVSDTVAAIFICDVMGHGVRSALITAIIRGLLEELKPIANEPGLLLTGLNHDLVSVLRHPDQLIFATAACLVLDTQTSRAAYASAGHPWGMHVPAAGNGKAHRMWPHSKPGDPPLGIDADLEYAAVRFNAAVGDRFLLFTDGLHEVTNHGPDQYGEPRLLTAVEKHRGADLPGLMNGILSDVEAFAGRKAFDDDLCVVAAEFAAPAGPATWAKGGWTCE